MSPLQVENNDPYFQPQHNTYNFVQQLPESTKSNFWQVQLRVQLSTKIAMFSFLP